jgi:hypothetical protein
MRRCAVWLMTNLVGPPIFIAIVMLMVPLALMVCVTAATYRLLIRGVGA